MRAVEHYEVLGVLGSGATGIVQAARDRRRGGRVALKRLRHDGPLDAAQLKREFRVLADVHHPNLVRLHEVFQDDGDVVLAMDLVPGRTLLHQVWDTPSPPPGGAESSGDTWSTLNARLPAGEVRPRGRPTLDAATIERLRAAVRGLAAGVSALHAAGLLHRDVKPSNVLVGEDGHVVLVDFGLAVRPEAVGSGVAGTIPYMAPEQIMGGTLGPASDWYAVGVLLFEALTGRTPFVGPPARVLFDKHAQPAPDPATLAPDAPEDLLALCRALLERDPAHRPDGAAVCAALGVEATAPEVELPFVGRVAELEALTGAAAGSGLRVVHLSGPSGLGKTRLVERFLETLPAGVAVLAARCYERERTPFKAVDPLADALATWLQRQPGAEVDALVPDALGSAVRLLPALARVPGLPAVGRVADPVTERQLAAHALRDLLRRVAARVPTVAWIDDLQWADRDSIRLLAQLLQGEDPPEALVLLGWRSDDPDVPELLAPLSEVPSTRIDLAPLPEDDARALVRARVRDEDRVAQVVAEAGGSPFFLDQLARWGGEPGEGSLLNRVLRERIGALSPPSRALLETVAVAGRPLVPELALRAARHAAEEVGAGEIATLTVARLLTTRRGRALECTHDRIREAVATDLPAEPLRARHRALAEALGEDGDPELLSEHWEQAGQIALAGRHALAAAERAEEALAFERAVALYRRALRLGAGDARQVRIALGRAQAKAGYAEAADTLLEAAEGAPERDALELEAAQQLLRSGHFERAYELLPRVVGRVGLRWPRTRLGALGDVLWNTALVELGAVRARGPRGDDREALRLAMELAMSLSYADMLRAAVFSARSIRLAEQIGEPETVALAAAMRGSNATLLGDVQAGQRFLAASVRALPPGAGETLRASVDLHHGIADAVLCRYAEAQERLARVVDVFQRHGGMPFEVGMARSFLCFALVQRGDLAAFRSMRSRVVSEARARGDKHQEVFFRVSYALQPGLLDDDPDATLADLAEAESRWGEGVSTAWLYTEVARAQVDVYRGRHAEALERILAAAGPARRGGLLRISLNALIVAITTASAAAPLGDRRAHQRAITAMAAVRTPLGPISAAIWTAAAGGSDAVAAADRALRELEPLGMPWLEAMVRAQRCRLSSGDPTPHHQALRDLGVRAPERLSTLYAYTP